MENKRLAIQLFGHSRTYKETYKNFFRYIVKPNEEDGWKIDIFIHTWDMSSSSDGSWHKDEELFNIHELSKEEIESIKKIYSPTNFKVEHLESGKHGGELSKIGTNKLREEYEKEYNIKYNYILYTRMDILFVTPLKIMNYLKSYLNKDVNDRLALPEKYCFCGFNPFVRSNCIDIRYIHEADIVYFTNFPHNNFKFYTNKDIVPIMIDYRLYRDFFLQRQHFIMGANQDMPSIKPESLDFKLGKAILFNTRSIFGWIKLPFVLDYIRKEHKNKKNAIKPINYDERKNIEILGQKAINANKNWYKGGFIKLIFEILKIKKELK